MKILILDFKNAGWFHRNLFKFFNEKDFVFDLNGQIKRQDFKKQYAEPITVNQISNVLHVLFGERPSASLRKTHIQEVAEIRKIALNGWIKIEDYCFENKKGNVTFFKEKLRTKKSIWNSWEKSNTLLYWKRIENFLEEELYNEFLEVIKSVLHTNNPIEISLSKTIEILHHNHLNNEELKVFLEKLKSKSKTPLYNTIKDGNFKNTDFNKNPRTMMTTNSGVSELVRLSGKIIIPIEDEKWIEKLKNSNGFARILDGGLVTVNSIIPDYNFYEESIIGFKEIKNISTELNK